MRETTNRGIQAGVRRTARERLVRSSLRCGREVFFLVVLFVWLVMSDVQEEEEMARYWYRKEKDWGWDVYE